MHIKERGVKSKVTSQFLGNWRELPLTEVVNTQMGIRLKE